MSSKINFLKYEDNIKRALTANNLKKIKDYQKSALDYYQVFKNDLDTIHENISDNEYKKIIIKIQLATKEIDLLNENIIKKKSFNISTSKNVLIESFENNKNIVSIEHLLEDLTDIGIQRGNQFHQNSKIITNFLFKITWISFVVTLLIIIFSGLYLERNILPHLKKLINTCYMISKGDYNKRAIIHSPCEFGTLGLTFNGMMEQIETRDANLNSLLDGLSSAVLSFDKSGIITEEKSKASFKIFPNFYNITTIKQFISEYTSFKIETLDKLLKIVFDPKRMLPLSSAIGLFPNKTTFRDTNGNDHHICFNYQSVNNPRNQELEKLILIADDITKEVESENEKKIQEERIERITTVSKNKESYQNFLSEVALLISNINNMHNIPNKDTGTSYKKLLLDLHTLKGLLALFSFNTCASMIHLIEDHLQHNNSDENFLISFEKMCTLFKEQKEDLDNTLSISNEEYLTTIYKPNLQYFKKILHSYSQSNQNLSKVHLSEINNIAKTLDHLPLSVYIKKYQLHLSRLQKKFHQKSATLILDESSDQLSFSEIEMLDKVFIHIINNSFDHGIENEDERLRLNKNPKGIIKISFKRIHQIKNESINSNHQSLIFKITDDGKGIDADFLGKKALEKGIWNEEKFKSASYEDKINLIFVPSFSSKSENEVSAISGRGVGMSAVLEDIQKLNGTLQVSTSVGIGTTFTIKLEVFS
ncbi:MAG: hypothetical protein HQK49_06285 [Oligoflexia bacterium]|nr:hypothetical protein [Oligoflexia bacterium]